MSILKALFFGGLAFISLLILVIGIMVGLSATVDFIEKITGKKFLKLASKILDKLEIVFTIGMGLYVCYELGNWLMGVKK